MRDYPHRGDNKIDGANREKESKKEENVRVLAREAEREKVGGCARRVSLVGGVGQHLDATPRAGDKRLYRSSKIAPSELL